MSTSERLMIFIDGQNFPYGCMSYKKGFEYDVDAFTKVLVGLRSNRTLAGVHYHASIAPIDPSKPGDDSRYRKQKGFYR